MEQLSVQDWLLLLYQETLYLSFGMRDDEFNGYIDRLIAAGYISTRVADGVTYYDAAITASDFSKSKLLKDLLPIIKAASEGVATAALKYMDSKLI